MHIRLALMLFFFLAPTANHAPAVDAAIWPATEWPRSTPEAQGMSSSQLADMLEWIENENPGIRSVTVVRHGTVVLDARVSPFARDDRHDIHSCTKSVVSALVGIAIDRGELPGLDTPVLDFFPDYQIADTDPGKDALTLKHLVTMSAGLKTEDSYLHDWVGLSKMRASGDWARFVLDLPLDAKPGTTFEYSNCVSQLIAIILQRATGQSLASYADAHLFGPIGIIEYTWEGSDEDDSWGFSGLRLNPLDMARLGYLFLRGGEWNGAQVVPAEWVATSTMSQISAGTLADGYGYQWWVDGDRALMQGYGGQLVAVVPTHDMVVVFAGALPQHRYFTPRRLLSDYIERAVVDDNELPANPNAAARLDSLVVSLSGDNVEPLQPRPDVARSISGKTYEFSENRMRLRSVTLRFSDGSPEAELEVSVGPMAASLTIGLDGVFRRSELFGQLWAWRGRWDSDDVFVVEQEAPGKVLRRRVTLHFQGEALSFEALDLITNTFETLNANLQNE